MPRHTVGQIGLIAAAAVVLAGCTSTTSRITTSYYVISGSTGAELDREIAVKGPLKGHALASTAIKFVPVSVRYKKAEGRCGYSDVKFRIEANITLPRWRENVRNSDRELRTAWQFLATYAKEHENVHIAIAEKYAQKIAKDLEALPAKRSCESLDAAAEKVLKRIKREHNREQLAFDAAEQKRLSALFD